MLLALPPRSKSLRTSNGLPKINLASVLIGNGFTNPKMQYASYHPTVCTNQTGYGPYVSEENCAAMAATLPRCQALVQKCYDDPSNSVICLSANTFCEHTQTEPYYETGRNPYDMYKFGAYKEEKEVNFFLNRCVPSPLPFLCSTLPSQSLGFLH